MKTISKILVSVKQFVKNIFCQQSEPGLSDEKGNDLYGQGDELRIEDQYRSDYAVNNRIYLIFGYYTCRP